MEGLLTGESLGLLLVSLVIGVVIGLTGMGGGALMTPALIVLGIPPTAAVANDLVVNAVNKIVGGAVHMRHGKPDLRIAFWLVLGSVPASFAGARLVHTFGGDDVEHLLKKAIGVTLLIAASAYVLRSWLEISGRLSAGVDDRHPRARPVPTLVVGAVGGLMVGVTSVGSGTVIMMCIMLLYPSLSALRLVGTDLVQAIPLVIAAAVGHLLVTGVDWGLLWPLLIGGSLGTLLGSRFASRVPEGIVRRGITMVLTLTGVVMLDLVPQEYLLLVAGVILIFGPLVWDVVRRRYGVRGANWYSASERGPQAADPSSSHPVDYVI